MTLLAIILALTVSPWFLPLARLRRPRTSGSSRRSAPAPRPLVLGRTPASDSKGGGWSHARRAAAPSDAPSRPHRTARPLDGETTSARGRRLGGRRGRPRRPRAEGRARALGRRLGGHRLRVRARANAIDARSRARAATRLMVAVHAPPGDPDVDRRRGDPPARGRPPRLLGRAAPGLEGRPDRPCSAAARPRARPRWCAPRTTSRGSSPTSRTARRP